MPEQKHGFRAFFTQALRPKKSRQVLRRKDSIASTTDLSTTTTLTQNDEVPPLPSLAPLAAHNLKLVIETNASDMISRLRLLTSSFLGIATLTLDWILSESLAPRIPTLKPPPPKALALARY